MEIKTQNHSLKLKTKIKPEIRFLYALKKVLYDRKWVKTAPNLELYYVWRGVKKKNGLRYDVTIIPPLMLGKEFVKTKGNRNSDNFLELYMVLEGEALILMQKTKEKTVKDVVAIRVKKGDAIIEPSGYAIITINPSKKVLKIGNWVSQKNKNIYREIEEMKGASYFYTKNGWLRNKNYKEIPKLRFKKPLKSKPKNLSFLSPKNN